MPQRYVLIGGGLAGARAAQQLRRQDAAASITLVSDEPLLPYDHPPLSKEYLRDEVSREQVFLKPEDFYREQQIALRLGQPAQKLDPAARRVTLGDGSVLEYDALLLATGGRARRLNVPGSQLPGVHYLRTLSDCDGIKADAHPGRRAVILGGGFIGMEVAASLTQRGVGVTVVEMEPHIWSRFIDQRLAAYFQEYCGARGIAFVTSAIAREIRGDDRVRGVLLESEQELPCDFICVGIGIQPNVEIAAEAGLQVDNGVVVNEYLETSAPDVYAAGDIAMYFDPLFQKRRRVEHWGHAEYTGLLAAQNMAGERRPYDLLSYVWSDIFDLHLEFAGEEKEHDQVLVRGSFEVNAFTVLYLKEGALRAYLSVNTPQREFPAMQRLIRRKTDLSGALPQLQDPEADLKLLV